MVSPGRDSTAGPGQHARRGEREWEAERIPLITQAQQHDPAHRLAADARDAGEQLRLPCPAAAAVVADAMRRMSKSERSDAPIIRPEQDDRDAYGQLRITRSGHRIRVGLAKIDLYISSRYIYGPKNSGQYYIQDNHIYGPRQSGAFYIENKYIYGPSGKLPFMKEDWED
jgi:hypothetical protein